MGLQYHISKDAESKSVTALNPAKASEVRDRGVVHEVARDDSTVLLNAKAEAWQGVLAGEGVSSLESIEESTLYIRPVVVDNVTWKEEQAGSGIGDREPVGGVEAGVANLESGGVEAPEAARVINWCVLDLSSVLRLVNISKVVRTSSLLHQVDGEQRACEVIHGVLEERLLLLRLHRVDRAKAQSKKTGRSSISLEGGRDFLSRLNSLLLYGYTANGNSIQVDNARRCASVAISDVPGCAVHPGRGRTESRVVLLLAILLVLGRLVGVDPEVSGAGIEVEVDCLCWSAYLNWGLHGL